jgi:superfamily I DNA and RNA helicase
LAYDEAQGIGTLTVPRPLHIFGLNPDGTPVVDLGGNKLPDGTITSPTYEGGLRKAHNLNRCYRTPKMLLMAAHAINMGLLRQEGCLQGVSNKEDWEKLGYTVLDGDFSDASVKAGKTVTVTREAKNSPHPIDSDDFPHKDALGSPLRIQTFSDELEEQEWIAQQVEEDLKLGFDPRDLLITCPTGDKEQQYFEAIKSKLSRRGIQSVIAGVDTNLDIFRMDNCITISTIFRAKGNEAWKVYACRFHCATLTNASVIGITPAMFA